VKRNAAVRDIITIHTITVRSSGQCRLFSGENSAAQVQFVKLEVAGDTPVLNE